MSDFSGSGISNLFGSGFGSSNSSGSIFLIKVEEVFLLQILVINSCNNQKLLKSVKEVHY